MINEGRKSDIGADGQPVDELKAALTDLYGGEAAERDTVLVCEDDPGVRKLLERALPRVLASGGLTKVLSFAGPSGAIEVLREQTGTKSIAVVFSDNDMPRCDDGFNFAVQFRGELGNNNVPFVLCSGRANKLRMGGTNLGPDVDRSFLSGDIDMVVSKPIGPKDLLPIVVSAIRRRVGLLTTGTAEPAEVFEHQE